MGKSHSKATAKVQDSIQFEKGLPNDPKMTQEEFERAICDKKRFALRLAEVEEALGKKNDQISRLEMDIKSLKIQLAEKNESQRIEVEQKEIFKKQNNHLRSLLQKFENPNQADLDGAPEDMTALRDLNFKLACKLEILQSEIETLKQFNLLLREKGTDEPDTSSNLPLARSTDEADKILKSKQRAKLSNDALYKNNPK
jgi:hypothetical protein